jgi:hypothetical protein
MFGFLKRWQKQRRRQKKLSMKYARQSIHILDIELDLSLMHQAMTIERLRLDLERQKRKERGDVV